MARYDERRPGGRHEMGPGSYRDVWEPRRQRWAENSPPESPWMARQPRTIYGPERYGLGPYHERLRRRRRPDDEIHTDVTNALFFDTWVDADAITVEVRDGIVTLRGRLPDYDEIRYATDDAWDVDGVVGVHCELEVQQ